MDDREDTFRTGDLDEVALDLVERALALDATQADERAMRAFGQESPAHARAVANAVDLHTRLLNARDAIRTAPDIVATIDWAKTWREPAPKRVIGRRTFLTGAVAASAAGVAAVYSPLGLWPTFAELRADYRTGTGERRTVQIAQGLSVELNTRTALTRRADESAYRLKLISGEVAVDARRLAQPAIIETGLGQAVTKDGQFSARLRDDGMCVTCIAGAVAVNAPEQAGLRLMPGQQTVIGGSAAPRIVPVDPEITNAWRRGALIFNGQRLSEVVGELNRYWSGRIVLTNAELGNRTVNAIFQLDRLGNAPVQIGNLTQATVTTLPGGIVLLS